MRKGDGTRDPARLDQVVGKRQTEERKAAISRNLVNSLFFNTALFILLAADDVFKALLQAEDGERYFVPGEAVG